MGASFKSMCRGILLVPCFLTENIKASHVTRFWNLAKQTQTSGGEQETPCAGLFHSRSGVCVHLWSLYRWFTVMAEMGGYQVKTMDCVLVFPSMVWHSNNMQIWETMHGKGFALCLTDRQCSESPRWHLHVHHRRTNSVTKMIVCFALWCYQD